MFCPKCNQQQASDEMRFCSRCGFPLSAVADLIAHNGVPAKVMSEDRLSTRQKGVRQGVLLLFASLIIGFFTALLSVFVIGRPELFVPLTAGILFLSGILRVAYAYMFESETHIEQLSPHPIQLMRSERGYALPEAQSVSATGFEAQRVKTAEIVAPPSVTERTTRLLNQDSLTPPKE